MLGVPIKDQPGPAEGGLGGEIAIVDIDANVGFFHGTVEGRDHTSGMANHDDWGHGSKEAVGENGGVDTCGRRGGGGVDCAVWLRGAVVDHNWFGWNLISGRIWAVFRNDLWVEDKLRVFFYERDFALPQHQCQTCQTNVTNSHAYFCLCLIYEVL